MVARALFALVLHPPLDHVYSDMANYVQHATRLASGAALDRYDVYEPTGTQLLLSLPMQVLGIGRAGLWGAAALWLVLSCIAPIAAWRWSRLLFGEQAGAWVAGLCALWPMLVIHTGYFLAETPAIAFLMCAVWAGEVSRRNPGRPGLALATGVLAGAAIGVRPQLVLNAAIVGWLAVRSSRRAAGGIAAGAALVVTAVIAFNTAAAGRPTGLSENGAMTFFQGQCDVALVRGGPPARPFYFRLTAAAQTHRGREYAFPGRQVYDQGFFFAQGWRCVRHDGVGHVAVLGRHLEDMLASSIPWPESEDHGVVRTLAEWSNRLMAAWLVLLTGIGLIALARRRPLREAAIPAAHLVCAPLIALAFVGDPRVALLYAPFALTLLGMTLARARRSVRLAP